MNDKAFDSNMDATEFSRCYAGLPDVANLDSSSREIGEWQFDGVAMSLAPSSSLSSDWQFDEIANIDDEECQVGGITFGLSCREIGEWQYNHPDHATAKQKLLDDSTRDNVQFSQLARPQQGTGGLTPLQSELAKWLPAT